MPAEGGGGGGKGGGGWGGGGAQRRGEGVGVARAERAGGGRYPSCTPQHARRGGGRVGGVGCVNWGLGWRSPGGRDWAGALSLHLCEAGRGHGNGGTR